MPNSYPINHYHYHYQLFLSPLSFHLNTAWLSIGKLFFEVVYIQRCEPRTSPLKPKILPPLLLPTRLVKTGTQSNMIQVNFLFIDSLALRNNKFYFTVITKWTVANYLKYLHNPKTICLRK